MKYTRYPELKAELKALAKEIREFKDMRDHHWDYPNSQGTYQWGVESRAREFRHKHIAYCMLRGRTYEQRENYCNESPDFDWIQKLKWEHGNEKTLRACA